MSLYTWHTKDLSTLVMSFVVTLTTAQGTYAASEVVVDNTHPSAAPSVNIINNVPVINIVAPNVDGLSHNKFLAFNVPTQGLIFNNSTLAGASDLAGQLNANSALNGHAATFILNEVTGLNTSLLQGYSEVFGQSASLVIANPNGIYANGAGFINTPNVLLTTGVPMFQHGQLSFNVEKGQIIVENKAIDLRFTQSTDLVAKQLILNAPLVASGWIGLYAGQGIFKGGNFSNSQHTQSTQLAIDASALGAMSAGRIFIIANEQGAGVKLDGQLSATADNIDISANGDLTLKNLHAKRDIDLNSATHNAYLTGQILAGENARIHAEGIAISGNIATNKRLDLHSNQDLVVTGQVVAGTTLNIDSAQHLLNQGLLYSTGDAHIEMGSIDNQQGLILSEAVLDIATLKGDLTNNGTIFAGTELNINSANHVLNQQQGELGSLGKTLVSAIGNIVNQDSTLSSNQDLYLRAGDNIIQNGIIDTKGSTTLRADDILLANNQQMNASGSVDLIAQQKIILASGTIKALGQVNIAAQADIRNNAAIDAGGKVSISTPSAFSNMGTVDTSSTLNFTIGKIITNQGRLYSQQSFDLRLNDNLVNDGGVIASENDVLLRKDSVSTNTIYIENNHGARVASNRKINISIDGLLINDSQSNIEAIGSILIKSAQLTNKDSTIESGGDLVLDIFDDNGINITGLSIDNDGGKLLSSNLLTINTAEDINNKGVIYGLSDLSIKNFSSVTNMDKGVIATDAQLNIDTGLLDTQHGFVSAVGNATLSSSRPLFLYDAKNYAFGADLTISSYIIANVKESQPIFVGGNLLLEAKSVQSPQFTVKNDIIIDADGVTSYSSRNDSDELVIASSQLIAGHDIKTRGALDLVPGYNYMTSDYIKSAWQAGNNIFLSSTRAQGIEGVLIANNDIVADGYLHLSGEDWACRTECKILAGRDFISHESIKNGGTIESGRDTHIFGDYYDERLANDQYPSLYAGRDLNITAPNYVYNTGVISAGNNINLQAATLENIRMMI